LETGARPGTALDHDSPPAPDPEIASRVARGVLDLDRHAVAERDDSFSQVVLTPGEAEEFLARGCEWEPPAARPAEAQGTVAGIPAKVSFEAAHTRILLPAPYAAAFERRLRRALADEPPATDGEPR